MHRDKEFGDNPFEYHKIIESIFIGGLSDDQIKDKIKNKHCKLSITCLFSIPPQTEKQSSQISFEFLYPDEQYDFIIPKFFSMTFTNEKGIRSFIYCLKISEEYIENDTKVLLPVVIGIKSYKADISAFKELFEKIYGIIYKEEIGNSRIRDTMTSDEILNCKKVELLNVFAFCMTLIKPSPHSNIKLVFPQEEDNKDSKQKAIDFYYHSNCEIPCNKNDSDINVLFSILDIEIIIKLVISILAEKQILIIASEAPLLYMLFPALIKLIFPFKWIHSYLPLLPSDQFCFLDAPVPYLIGILSINKDNPEVRSIIDSNESKVIVDCCSNEIFGFKEYYPYYFKPNNENNISDRLLYFERTQVFAYDLNKKSKKIPTFPTEIDKIIIDCHTNKVLCNKNSSNTVDHDLKALRQKIQLAKNPDIFNLDEFSFKQKANEIGDEIQLDKPFSYNIQNIFFNFYKRKYNKYLEQVEDKLINSIKDTNLYENFVKSAKYQNDSGNAIFNNINSNFNRSFANCYEVSYIIPLFPIKKLMNEFKEKKIKDEVIEKSLNDYGRMKGLIRNENKSSNKNTSEKGVQSANSNITKAKHQKNKRSQLQKSLEGNVFNFNKIHTDNDLFRFYNNKGFIQFAERFYDIIEKAEIDIMNLCYFNNIYSDVFISIKNEINAINNELNKELNQKEEGESNVKQNKEDNQYKLGIIEEEGNDINVSRGSFMETHLNCSSELNLQFQMEIEEGKPMIKFNENNSIMQYYLFLVYNIEHICNDNIITKLLDQNNIQWNIDDIIIQLYIKAYHIDKADFPLFHFSLFAEQYFKRVDVEHNPFKSDKEELLYEISELIKKKIDEKNAKEVKILAIKSKTEGERKMTSILSNRKTYEKESQLSYPQVIELNNPSFRAKEVVPFDISSEVQSKRDSEKNEMQIGKSSIEYKTSTSSSGGNKVEEYYQKIVINTKDEFCPEAMPVSAQIISQISEIMYAFFLSYKSGQNESVYNIIELISSQLINSTVKELISELADMDLKLLRHTSEKIAFWINCFNYLILFTIFYKKWVINNIHDWKYFLKNVHYEIAHMEISFSDMQYILLGRVLFFDSEYKPSKTISKLCIKKITNHPLLSFLLYLPTGILLSPKVLHSIEIDNSTLLIDNFKEYLDEFVKIDSNQYIINIPEFLYIVDVKWNEKYNK